MNEIDLKQIITGRFKNILIKYPNFIQRILINLLNKIIHIDEINNILKENSNKYGFEFIEEIFEYLDFTYVISYKDKLKIPAEGKLIIVANHPLGGLDGLALIKTISEIRRDVKIVANDLLLHIDNLSSLFLPYDIFSPVNRLKQIKEIEKSLLNDEAVIFFPAAEVSRMTWKGIKDKKWLNGPIKLAKKVNSSILPVYIEGQNTMLFYLISLIYKPFSILFLSREIFKKKKSEITIKISDPIPSNVFASKHFEDNVLTSLLKSHVYKIGKGKSGIFKSEKNIIHPVNIKDIRKELYNNKLIGRTNDDKEIYLVSDKVSENVLREISRLREITFRNVGEGTGKKADTDSFDKYYKHIILWDDKNLEIVGAYRLGLGCDILEQHGFNGFYTYQQFLFSSNFINIVEQGMELGRSFIQRKYWKSFALDYLWQGIGAFLKEYPDIKYLFGTVSISDSYSDYAKNLIVYYYKKWYSFGSNLCISKYKYLMSNKINEELSLLFTGTDPESDFRILKDLLKNIGFSVPVLYRRYTELCEYGGVEFLDFGVDKSFSNSVDGFILVNLSMIKNEKRERYYFASKLIEVN
ncbi:GNAT family N-acetyltransferase [Bacteroidetes/Chlorobi group bacterium ChocPot_Mid]|jgi:putative hemolysin|nr:MAG: GNAT family N-acetyltransferase [Bacteroidetes/Chlorobi group bacterium ChocPot_Mid]